MKAVKGIPSAGNAISADAAKKAQTLISEAVIDGAEFLVGSAELVEKTSLAPSILVNLNSKSRIYRDESFAPSASLFVVSTDEEAIERANDTEFGLSASLFTRDYKKAIQYARELDFGQVQINGPTIYADGEFLQLVMSVGHALTFL